MKIVVIGATGNLGTSTLRALSREPAMPDVVAIARRKADIVVPRTTFVQADITRDDLVPLLRGADAVIHLAWLLQPARELDRLHQVNVEGSRRVFDAAATAQVPALIYASSIGAYSPGPKHRFVDESWPTDGIPSSLYSQQKVSVERYLDRFEAQHPAMRVVRMRPALVFKRVAASEIRRVFIGPLVPRFLFAKHRLRCVPDVPRLRFQCVHSHDVGRALALAALNDVRGAFNLATDPVLDAELLADVLHARRFRMSEGALRRVVSAAYNLHMTPTDPGWVDLGLESPLIDIERARVVLGWSPRRDAPEALLDLLEGLRTGSGLATAPLHN
jgi:nucleoside-diphosphate-sugar epimerase